MIPQIETKSAVNNLERIKSYDFDYYLIGPYDLSLSLGDPGNFKSNTFALYLDKICDTISEDKRAIHIPNNVNEQIDKYKNYGLKCLGMDTVAILEYNKGIINA